MKNLDSARYQLRHNLTEDFIDLLLPPDYAYSIETSYPETASMGALIKDRFNSLDFPEQKILNLELLMEEGCIRGISDRVGDWAVLFSYEVLEGFGHKQVFDLKGGGFEGLKQLASLWGVYLAREMERIFGRWRFFTTITDFVFDFFLSMFRQIPAKELGEAIRESVTPSYIRTGEMVRYEIALFHNDQVRMRESIRILSAPDSALENEIADMFKGYSAKRLGEEMQRSITEAISQFKDFFSSNKFRKGFDNQMPTAMLSGFRDMSWYLGYRINQNLKNDPGRTIRLLEAITQHKEIEAAMEQYRYRRNWQGDRNKAVVLGWQAIAPKYLGRSGKLEEITEDEDQEKLIGLAQGLEDCTEKSNAINVMTDGFSGGLSAYLKAAAKNQERDYWDRRKTRGNKSLTEAKHSSDLFSVDKEEDVLTQEEILSRAVEKQHPSGNPLLERLEKQESYSNWYNSLTKKERMVVDLKQADFTEERIAEQMAISQQRVSQLLQQAWKKWLRNNR